MAADLRYHCYVRGCRASVKASRKYNKDISELSRHFKAVHQHKQFDHFKACLWNWKRLYQKGKFDSERNMDPAEPSPAGRPQREKKPTEKVKVAIKSPQKTDDKEYPIPPKYVMPAFDPKWAQEPKEIAKIYDHTKVSKITGEKIDLYKLGNHVESRDKHHYTRAQRDPVTGYFHAAEAAPHYARISDEDHPLCAAEHADIVFTKDMLSTSHSAGHTTARANVFARDGVYYFEAKLTSMSHELAERHDESLITTELKAGTTKEDTCRGSVRVGFVRREHHHGHPIGTTGYGYGLATFGNGVDEYGNGRFWGRVFKLSPKNPGKLKEGDVVGLMITLPDLRIHQKVADGTFDQARDAPGLECGPYVPKKTKAAGKTAAKKGKAKAGTKDGTTEASNSDYPNAHDHGDAMLHPAVVDIIRDRVPFEHKGKGGQVIYFESPEYTVNRDIESGATGKGKSINPETNTIYDLTEDTHPNHALPHLRTLPGSKIEVWVNGEYQGILAKHLLAFLPPCSYIDKISKQQGLSGALDDGTLGYYPAVTTYGGGAAELRFDEPFWFPPTDRPEAQPFGKRYQEQIIDDFVSDLIDEVCMEKTEEHFGVATAGTIAPSVDGDA